jgi:molecular chaperone DnaK
VDAAAREEIEAAIKDIRDNLESGDAVLLVQKTEALQAAFHKVSEQMYAQAAQAQQSGGNGAASPEGADGEQAADEEEVVDAEVVDPEEKG